jgi:hypothetical protein
VESDFILFFENDEPRAGETPDQLPADAQTDDPPSDDQKVRFLHGS